MKLSWGIFKLFNLFPALKDINRCLIFGIIPSQVLNFFQNLPSLKIGAYRLVLIKQNACNLMCHTSELLYLSSENKYTQTLIKRTSPLDPFYSLYPIIQYIKCNMLSKSLGFVHYILRFVILKFECTKIWVGGGGEWRQQVQVRINFQPDKTVHILLYPLNTHISL